jgi:hypothetical protein
MYSDLTFFRREVMLPTPQVGQLVRLDDYDGRLVVKQVSSDGSSVDLVSEFDASYERRNVPCLDLLLAEDYSTES